MKKSVCFVLSLALIGCLSLSVSADEPSLMSVSAVLMDADTGRVLFEKNGHRQMYPASITKILTGMLALQNLELDQTLTMSKDAYYAIPAGASSIHLRPGEEITAEQAMYALTVQSANDAANLLAEGVSGDLASFHKLMNETAQALGAENTHFANANGLPRNDHYTTAYDMAKITAGALKTSGLCDYFSTVRYTIPPTNLADWSREMVNDNKMLSGYYHDEDILMSKTGWTEDAQHTLVSAISRNGTTLIAVVMYTVPVDSKYIDTWALFDFGFSHYEHKIVTGEELAARLNLEQQPEEGQTFSLLLPVEAAWTDVELTALPAEQGRITLEAAYEGQRLPDLELTLLPPETVPTTQETTLPPTQQPTEPAAESDSKNLPLGLLLIPAALAVTAFLFRKKAASHR